MPEISQATRDLLRRVLAFDCDGGGDGVYIHGLLHGVLLANNCPESAAALLETMRLMMPRGDFEVIEEQAASLAGLSNGK